MVQILLETVRKYACDSCKKISPTKEQAKECERKCVCEHSNVRYFVIEDRLNWPEIKMGVEAECRDCNKSLGEFDFNNLENEPKLLKVIWATMNQYYECHKGGK